MKFDFFNSLIALSISALLTWGAYSMTDTENLKSLVAVVTFITLGVSSICSIAIKLGEERSSIVNRATSAVFFFLLLIINMAFTFFDFSKPLYIIINGIVMLIMLIILRAVTNSKM